MLNEEELVKELEEQKKPKKMTTRQHALKNWLDVSFVSGKFFSIEEVVAGVVDKEGKPYYKLNSNPRNHDKCIALSNDVREINWLIGVERYIPIIKDQYGGVKLCESKKEFDDFYNLHEKRVSRHYQYLNALKSKVEMDGYVPIINLAGRVLSPEEQQPIDTLKR